MKAETRRRLNFYIVAGATPGLYILSLIIGYWLAEWLFSFINRPGALWVYAISVLLGLLVFICSVRIIHRRLHAKMEDIFTLVTDALNKIAQGNFDVVIPVNRFIMARDDFQNMAETVNQMAKELSSMEKLRQDFISNVSHEIQSPLTSISGFAALLKSETLSAEERRHYLDIIETESKRLSKLSDNLLKLSSLQAEHTSFTAQEFRLDKQIEGVVLMLEPQWLEKNINLDLSLQKLVFVGNEELLMQVWINLLHNAIKFTPQLGSISIRLTEKENGICCVIADSGIGIAKADQIHLFERFFKVDTARDRSLGGNGLGLSLVKKIVDIHRGQITLNSTLGEGTEFTITLLHPEK
ncbi:sensor histidine kinase [Pelosinus sp. sgz500959]|uniref:sensor histidine kinase n=1 Tax=Pelosinus sp. sgz500959 TaxID=3242472 RepID=UPI003670AC89